jgi:hypothetical protein
MAGASEDAIVATTPSAQLRSGVKTSTIVPLQFHSTWKEKT